MAIRPEKVPGLRSSTLMFIKKASTDMDVGALGRKDFLDGDNIDATDKTYKVWHHNAIFTLLIRCQLFFLKNFSNDVKDKLIEGNWLIITS